MTTPTLALVSLDSTILAAAAYDNGSEELQLHFRDGTRYLYSGVAPHLYYELLRAVSQGVFFNRYIRDHFPHTKLPVEN